MQKAELTSQISTISPRHSPPSISRSRQYEIEHILEADPLVEGNHANLVPSARLE